jgi:hypothetical protein
MKRASLLVFLLFGCGSTTEPAVEASPVSPASLTASPSIAPLASAEGVVSAAPSASAPEAISVPLEMTAEQLQALTLELESRRVFRHLTLGNMPVRARDSWLLSDDSKQLTLTCEREVDEPLETGSPVPKRWFVVASATFAATDVPAGKAWAATYRRAALTRVRDGAGTLCTKLGEELTLDCKPASVQLYGPTAFVPVETRREEPIRWRPSTARAMNGLGCDAKADGFRPSFYESSSSPKLPMVFFADKKVPVERLVHSDAVQYMGFREAALTPFDGSLPEYLRAQ